MGSRCHTAHHSQDGPLLDVAHPHPLLVLHGVMPRVILWISYCTCFGFYYKYFDPVNPTICSPVANKIYQLLKIYQMLNWKYQTSWNTTTASKIATFLEE